MFESIDEILELFKLHDVPHAPKKKKKTKKKQLLGFGQVIRLCRKLTHTYTQTHSLTQTLLCHANTLMCGEEDTCTHTHTHTHFQYNSPFGADGSTVIADVSHINEAHHVLTTTEYTHTHSHTHSVIHTHTHTLVPCKPKLLNTHMPAYAHMRNYSNPDGPTASLTTAKTHSQAAIHTRTQTHTAHTHTRACTRACTVTQ